MKKAVIITGGGLGHRMCSDIPKQFLDIGGKPLIVHTIDVFIRYDRNIIIVVVLPEDYFELWKTIEEKYYAEKDIILASGGKTRFDSVKNGLALLGQDMIIAIHDAVRPMVSVEIISKCYDIAEAKGSAIPVVSLSESVRKEEQGRNYFVSREGLRIVQTPQVFRGEIVKEAYNRNYKKEFTDDAIVVEKAGNNIFLTEGNVENIKITTPFDLRIARSYLTGN